MTRAALLSLSLALLLAVTSLSFGAARGQARIAGQVVLCQGALSVTVAVDENGQPVGPVHLCPDCVLGALDSPPLAAAGPLGAAQQAARLTWPAPSQRPAAAPFAQAQARAPPAGALL